MQINIERGKQVRQIQSEFNAWYPYLKIDFLKIDATDKKRRINANDLMIVNGCEPAELDISGTKTVTEVKQDFKTLFNLEAEVYRKSGAVWIETSLTDGWTLAQQNKEGELISSHTQSG